MLLRVSSLTLALAWPLVTHAQDGSAPSAHDGGAAASGAPDALDSPTEDARTLDLGDAGNEVASNDAGDGGMLEQVEPAAEPPWESTPAAPLPPAAPDPEIAPIVVGPEAIQGSPAVIAREDRPAVAIGTLLFLLSLLALAYLGGHPRVQALERKLGVSQVITAGFPFVLLGLLARTPAVGGLSDSVLADLGPLLRIGLGCIGFVAGFRFSAQFRAAPGPGVVRIAVWATLAPFALVAVVSGAVLLLFSGGLQAAALSDPVFIRDALILGTAGAMTARTSTELFRADDIERVLARVLRLEELAGIFGLAVVAAYFRPATDVTWQLPGTAWLLLTLGLGVTLGLVCYFVFKRRQEGAEFVVLTLGAISFGAGVAGYLRLSPVVVCFVASACLGLLPLEHKDRIRSALRRLERPVYLLSLIAIGALWQVDDWRGWLLIPVFTAARFAGKWLGAHASGRHADLWLRAEERRVLAVAPMGPLSIAIVVNAQLLYPGGSISLIVAAVVGGAILTEVIVQLASRRGLPPLAVEDARGRASVVLSEPPEAGP